MKVDKKVFETTKDAVDEVLEFENSLRGTSKKPRENEAKLLEAAEVLKADPKNVPAEGWADLEKAILEHLQYDQQRRGLSQPVPAISETASGLR
ncbi:hypothetical protein [Thiohalophilus sp.]|uniref:hypothetical protein n=1 Tax=Thiohalophilus sp. TaxID=3028392 RepID=UPI002ACDDEC3|nr:hypothetical protein [Thiohalophilus sp.]MDZ7802365.1 hypothetical protein [Thiohalophilus sp.]